MCRISGQYSLASHKVEKGEDTFACFQAAHRLQIGHTWHLARNGQRMLVVDLDMESPGLSSAMLDARQRPRFGVADWFVEDLTDLHAQVLLFALDSDSHWADYTILFRHWQEQEVAAAARERLSIVAE